MKACVLRYGAMCLLVLLPAMLLLAWQSETRPVFTSLEYATDGRTWRAFQQPLWLWNETGTVKVRTAFSIPSVSAGQYAIRHSGTLSGLTINGKAVPGDGDGLSPNPRNIAVRDAVVLETSMRADAETKLLSWSMTPAAGNRGSVTLAFLLCFATAASSYPLLRMLGWTPAMAGALTLGIVLRLLSALATPEWVRSYDWEGHREYVLYMTRHWTIPPATLGWETYQPPLFYVLAAGVRVGLLSLGFDRYEALQMLPLFLSIFTLIMGALACRTFWNDDRARVLCVMLLAVFPGLITESSRISNDGLLTFLGVLWLFFLLRFAATRHSREWMLASVTVTLAMLTKANALILVAAQVCSLVVLALPWKRRMILLGGFLLTVIGGAGWLYVLRFAVEKQTSIVGNVHLLPDMLRVPNTAEALFSFNLPAVIIMPFVSDVADWTGRRYFLEYLFKSSLFGSHVFPPLLGLARLIVLSAFSLLLLSVAGAMRTWRSERTRLLMLVIACLAGGAFFFRLLHPMSPDQHFRFITPVILPIAILAASSASPHAPRATTIAQALITGFALLSVLFLCSLLLWGL